MTEAEDRQVVVGRVAGVFGVKGWIRVYTYTDPPENILKYTPWLVGEQGGALYQVTDGTMHGRGVIAHLQGLDDRDLARKLIGSAIRVPRTRFGNLSRDEYYWSDLMGLTVMTLDGISLGRVEDLMATGANDVMIVQGDRRRLVPFVPGEIVRSVDTKSGVITVSWDADF